MQRTTAPPMQQNRAEIEISAFSSLALAVLFVVAVVVVVVVLVAFVKTSRHAGG